MPFPNRVREYRLREGLTLRELSAHTGIDFGQLSKIETGAGGASDARKVRLAEFFNVSVGELFFPQSVETNSTEREAVA